MLQKKTYAWARGVTWAVGVIQQDAGCQKIKKDFTRSEMGTTTSALGAMVSECNIMGILAGGGEEGEGQV